MKTIRTVLPLCFAFFVSSITQAQVEDKSCTKEEEKRIASYNLHQESWMDLPKYWKFRSPDVQTILRSLEADIIHLQETSPDRSASLQKALPQFQLWQGEGGLATFVRSSQWTVLSNKTLLAHEELAVQELRVIPHNSYDSESKVLWNVWLRPQEWTPSKVTDTLNQLLREQPQKPTAMALSLRAPDRQRHDRAAWHQFLRESDFRQADPHSFAITTNGWWATKWTTEDWHDALLTQRSWVLAKSEMPRRKVGGAYPSMHFPLVAHYCPRRELIVDQMAP